MPFWQMTTKQDTCTPMYHVVFNKVPKTGSSTFSSVLNMIALKNNISVFSLQLNIPHPNDIFHLRRSNHTSRFDMQIGHGIFNETFLRQKMKSDAMFVATLREPFSQFRSFFFFKHHTLQPDTIEDNFRTALKRSAFHPSVHKLTLPGKLERFANAMFKYFQFNITKAMLNDTYFKECLLHLDNMFYIVMTDFYDESLLLLKEELCWDITDIIYIP